MPLSAIYQPAECVGNAAIGAIARPCAKARAVWRKPVRSPAAPQPMINPCRATISAPRALYVDAPLAAAAAVVVRPRPGQLPRSTCCGSSTGTRCCCSTAATANGRRKLAAAGKRALTAVIGERMRRAAAAVRPAFPVCPAQACPARLSGAEGGGNGGLAAAAGDHPPYASGAGQSRAHARQCHRGGAAVRHFDPAGGCRAGLVQSGARAAPTATVCWCSATRTPR